MADPGATEHRVRIAWVDFARGVGIFLVVLGHVLRGLHSGEIITDGPAYRFADSWIYAFHMPLFFLLSGLFAERRVGRAPGAFSREIVGSIAYPYFVWSVIQTLMQVALSRHTNHRTELSALAWIPAYPIMQFWFLYVLFFVYIAYYALRRVGVGPLGAFAAFVAFWASQGWLDLGPWWPINATRANGIYFALGAFAARCGWTERIGRAPAPALGLLLALGYGAVAAAVAGFPGDAGAFDHVMKLVVAVCGIVASVALAALMSRVRALDFVRVMGVHSLEIYVAHTIVSAGLRILLVKGFSIRDVTAHVAIGTVGGILFPLLLSLFCRRYHAEFLFRLPARTRHLDHRPREVAASA
jgi:fucose 4-O-acetylase-like acetyltransferase